ncbi:hypothetical protein CRG98_047869 [Punica granatum]|uniref:Uncharacterized protein n=1 Tax=Punica granatum TaxID=22663 RepID=A0A2I0HKB7_PUNGR|nr:hypothetical protein CRG98_047869 [Punica granatum]
MGIMEWAPLGQLACGRMSPYWDPLSTTTGSSSTNGASRSNRLAEPFTVKNLERRRRPIALVGLWGPLCGASSAKKLKKKYADQPEAACDLLVRA